MPYTEIEVEPNDNTPMSAHQVYKNLTIPVRVRGVVLYEGQPEGVPYDVTGWSAVNGGSTVDAYAVQVEDSGSGSAWVVYGGDCGVRLRPAGTSAAWDLGTADQFGETHLVLADREDIIEA